MICPPCASAADFSAALAGDFAAEAVDGAICHDPEICHDHGKQIRACACQHRAVRASSPQETL